MSRVRSWQDLLVRKVGIFGSASPRCKSNGCGLIWLYSSRYSAACLASMTASSISSMNRRSYSRVSKPRSRDHRQQLAGLDIDRSQIGQRMAEHRLKVGHRELDGIDRVMLVAGG